MGNSPSSVITFSVYLILSITACVFAWIVMMGEPLNDKGTLIGIGVGSTILTILAFVSLGIKVFKNQEATKILPLFLVLGAAVLNFTGIILANQYGNVACPGNTPSCSQTKKNNFYAAAVTTTLMSLVFGFYGIISILE